MYDYGISKDEALGVWVLIEQTWAAMYNAVDHQLRFEVGITPEQLEVCWACREYAAATNGHPLGPSELSRLLFRKPQTIAGLLNRMEKDGLVERARGHFTEIKMTPKGEEACASGATVVLPLIHRIMALSSEELGQLADLIRRVRENTLVELPEVRLRPPPSPRYLPL